MKDNNELLLVDKSQITRFRRGFKSFAENTAITTRTRLGLSKYSPLSPYKLTEYLKIRVLTPKNIAGLAQETINYLTSSKGDEWSAMTLRAKAVDLIIINPFHSERRQSNTLMHELSHILLNHKPTHVFINDTGIAIRSYDELQEAEADWLAGTLLLPRDVLVQCHFKHYSEDQACNLYGVSTALFTYRMTISGVRKQFYKKN